MTPKNIIVPFMQSKDDMAALEYALELGSIYESRVEVLYIAPDYENVAMPALIYDSLPYLADGAVQNLRETNAKRLKAAEKAFLKVAEEKHSQNVSFSSITGLIEDVIAAKGRISDLIVMPRTEENINYNNCANGALFGSGCPVLFVPPGYKKKFNGKVLIAWNGSREAANSVHRVLPYLIHGKVSILTAMEPKKKGLPVIPEDLKDYLGLHDIFADVIPPIEKESSLPISILNAAKMLDAGMIVMGGWGHGRFHEFITGGVTDYMINHAGVPIFMVH